MKRLPLEMLLMIFEKVDLINLIRLRQICKYWKYIIDNNKIIKELIIYDKYCQFKYSKTNSIIFLDQFKLDNYQIFRKIISSNYLINLKYLNYNFECNYEDKNQLINLNCFKLLEHLVLAIQIRESQQLILVHPNIRCLSVNAWTDYEINDDLDMEINCPKCENLTISGRFKISCYDIIYPERIKIFRLAIYDFERYENIDGYEIDQFINIETLEIDSDILNFNEIIPKISKFSKLKKIAVKYKSNCCDEYYIIQNIRRFLYDLIDLISKKQIKIFFNNEEMKSKKQIKKIINKELGQSLDLITYERDHDSSDSDYFYNLMEIQRENSTDSDD